MKKLLSILLTLVILFTLTSPVTASEITTEGEHTVPVDLTVETPIFSVTVPTSLPITLTEYGEILVADDISIINGSAGPVRINTIETKGINGWSTIAYGSLDITNAKVGSKNVGLSLNIATSTINTTGPDTNDFIGSIVLSKGQTIPVTYGAELASQKDTQYNLQIAEVIFTVGWDD